MCFFRVASKQAGGGSGELEEEEGAMTPRGCLICAPLVARSVSQMLTQMQEAKANGADVVESRVDHIPGFNAAKDLPVLLNARTLPMIVTARFALDFSKSVTNFFLFLVLHHQTSACFQGRSKHRFCFSLSLSLIVRFDEIIPRLFLCTNFNPVFAKTLVFSFTSHDHISVEKKLMHMRIVLAQLWANNVTVIGSPHLMTQNFSDRPLCCGFKLKTEIDSSFLLRQSPALDSS